VYPAKSIIRNPEIQWAYEDHYEYNGPHFADLSQLFFCRIQHYDAMVHAQCQQILSDEANTWVSDFTKEISPGRNRTTPIRSKLNHIRHYGSLFLYSTLLKLTLEFLTMSSNVTTNKNAEKRMQCNQNIVGITQLHTLLIKFQLWILLLCHRPPAPA